MIHEVDEGLRLLLEGEGLPGDGVELVFDAPTKEWTAKRTAPTISVFLYDLREDLGRRRGGTLEEHDGDGVVVGWRQAPRWYQLSYLLTAWTNRPQDEHRLLAEVLRGVSRHHTLGEDCLTGSLAELGLAVPFESAGPVGESRAATDIWSALGGSLKPAIDLRVTAPLAGEREPAGPAVSEGVLLRTGPKDGAGADEAGRALRYEGAADTGGTRGFKVLRPKPPVRRRRGAPS